MRRPTPLPVLVLLLIGLAPGALALPGGDVEVEGTVTALADAAVAVDGVGFAVTDATEIRDDDGDASCDDLAVGQRLEARGRRRAHGVDNRSFRLNFEVTVLAHDRAFSADVAAMLEADLARSTRFTEAELLRKPLPFRLAVAGTRLLAPVL